MTFNAFIYKQDLKKATSSIKTQQVLSYIGLNNVGICLQDEPFESDIRIVN